jgi:hypothetical protein
MRPYLLVLALVVFSFPATAQITAGPPGPFVMVDDNGKLIGGVAGIARQDVVSLDTSQGDGFIPYEYLDGVYQFRLEDLYFVSSDCTTRRASSPVPAARSSGR